MWFWWHFRHWLHRKLTCWKLSPQPVAKMSSKCWHFRFSGYLGTVVFHWIMCPDSIKMSTFQYRKSNYCADKMILRPLYLHQRISCIGKTSLHWIAALEAISISHGMSFRNTCNISQSLDRVRMGVDYLYRLQILQTAHRAAGMPRHLSNIKAIRNSAHPSRDLEIFNGN